MDGQLIIIIRIFSQVRGVLHNAAQRLQGRQGLPKSSVRGDEKRDVVGRETDASGDLFAAESDQVQRGGSARTAAEQVLRDSAPTGSRQAPIPRFVCTHSN